MRKDVTSAQLQVLLEGLEADADLPAVDKARRALFFLEAAANTFVFPPPGLKDPPMRVFIEWVQSGVGNERLSTAFQQRGLQDFSSGDYTGTAISLYLDVQLRAFAGIAPDLAEIQSYHMIVASLLALGDYGLAANAQKMLIDLDVAVRGTAAVLEIDTLDNLRLLYFADEASSQWLHKQSPRVQEQSLRSASLLEVYSEDLRQSRPKPELTALLQRQLDTSVFTFATTAFAAALAKDSNSTDAESAKSRNLLLEAQAIALLGLGKNAAADAAFAKALAEPQSAEHKAERSAWFARVKADQLSLMAQRAK